MAETRLKPKQSPIVPPMLAVKENNRIKQFKNSCTYLRTGFFSPIISSGAYNSSLRYFTTEFSGKKTLSWTRFFLNMKIIYQTKQQHAYLKAEILDKVYLWIKMWPLPHKALLRSFDWVGHRTTYYVLRCICGFMSNLTRKSLKDSTPPISLNPATAMYSLSCMGSRNTDAQRGNSLYCMAKNSIPIPNF